VYSCCVCVSECVCVLMCILCAFRRAALSVIAPAITHCSVCAMTRGHAAHVYALVCIFTLAIPLSLSLTHTHTLLCCLA
jgi:hypothetical protein